MQRKKLDSRIPALIGNGVATGHRSFLVLVGDRGKDAVVTLHYLLTKARVMTARPSVLWCYKKELGFSSHRKKRMNQIKKEIARGIRDADTDDPFELFISSTDIRYTYYKETEKVLGTTWGMCILQDFEAITPNLLARTIETVEGGGLVVLLLRSMSSLKQLYTMTMDVHARYRTDSHGDTVARFNERFILSLGGGCENCLVLDDELNVLPISAGKDVRPIARPMDVDEGDDASTWTPAQRELAELKISLADTQPAGSLIQCTKTLDQAKAVLTFIDAIADKSLSSTVALTAARGRGKSAALGLAIASAVAYGYSNIFLTSPSPENLKTLFEFVFKGFDALGYKEHLDYDILQSTDPNFQKAVVRVNIYRDHRQTIQWIQPCDHHVLTQAELVVIDEAAAIPLPTVKRLLGPYLVFMASTINGYEGTGRSLSLKLIQQLRESSRGGFAAEGGALGEGGASRQVDRDGKEVKAADSNTIAAFSGRKLKEISLQEPIRYTSGDPIESWLNKLLCLDTTPKVGSRSMAAGTPHPSKCDLFYVNRDTLFSYHPVSEAFLQKMMNLYVASHYKNSPNDLQLLSDAPAHHLFVLLPPVNEASTTTLPEPLVVIQVCLEGTIAKGTALSSLARGIRAAGDLIPWVMTQQFQDENFASLSGVRIVRIATHPDYIGMGYGARAMEVLERYYAGEMTPLGEEGSAPAGAASVQRESEADLAHASLHTDRIQVRDVASMPYLLCNLNERPLVEDLQWMGVSFGMTRPLFKFWRRAGYAPTYVRQTTNELTGEHTCIMLKTIKSKSSDASSVIQEDGHWLSEFSGDFKRRFLQLMGYEFKSMPASLMLNVIESALVCESNGLATSETPAQLVAKFSPFDLKRLASYSQNLLDYHVIMDLVPTLAQSYFLGAFDTPAPVADGEPSGQGGVVLSGIQAGILLGVGLQKRPLHELEVEFGLANNQVLALFGKVVRRFALYLEGLVERGVAAELEGALAKRCLKQPGEDTTAWDPVRESLAVDLEGAGLVELAKLKEKQTVEEVSEQEAKFRQRQRELIDGLNVEQYAIPDQADGEGSQQWTKVKLSADGSNVVSLPNAASTKKRKHQEGVADELVKKYHGLGSGVVDKKNKLSKSSSSKKSHKKKHSK